MRALRNIRAFVEEIRFNLNVGSLAWAFHRITGIGLAIYLILHLITLSSAVRGANSFQDAFATLDNTPFAVVESVIVVAVAYHMFNGLRVIGVDFFGLTRQQRFLAIAVMVASLGVMAWTTAVFLERIFGHD
jgi:succinate dehydrogenase cytochrome b subunit